jgi:hypothetical protein
LRHAANAKFLAVDDESTALRYPKTVRAIIINIRKLDPRKRRILLYASEANWPGDLGQDGNWVANWSREPRIPWDFWQYSGTGLDRDWFHGTAAQLKAWV